MMVRKLSFIKSIDTECISESNYILFINSYQYEEIFLHNNISENKIFKTKKSLFQFIEKYTEIMDILGKINIIKCGGNFDKIISIYIFFNNLNCNCTFSNSKKQNKKKCMFLDQQFMMILILLKCKSSKKIIYLINLT